MKPSHPLLSKWDARHKLTSNLLCLGLDPDIEKLPEGFSKDLNGVEEFLSTVIKLSTESVISYKPNISFFEAMGLDGLRMLERIIKQIPSDIPIILDAKRGDIGNTASMQARYLFDYFGADATTLHPYMGEDSISPFLEYKDKYHFILALTSNPGAADFEKAELKNGEALYTRVIDKALEWHTSYQNLGLVVGATQGAALAEIRTRARDLLFLVPGVGAQGADYSSTVSATQNSQGLSLINQSRSILYAAAHKDDMESAISKELASLQS